MWPCCPNNIVLLPNPCAGSTPCEQWYNSDCVKVNGTLSCGSFGPNPILTTVLQGFCSGFTNIGTTLSEVLTELTTLNTVVNDLTGCVTWTDLSGFTSGNTAYGPPFQVPQVSNVDHCKVQLRGVIRNANWNNAQLDLLELPVGARPTSWRMFSINVPTAGTVVPISVIITDTGFVSVGTSSLGNGDEVIISLDGISFEVAPY